MALVTIFEPKSIVERGIAESMEEFKAGRSFGPYASHQEFLAALHKEAKKAGTKSETTKFDDARFFASFSAQLS